MKGLLILAALPLLFSFSFLNTKQANNPGYETSEDGRLLILNSCPDLFPCLHSQKGNVRKRQLTTPIKYEGIQKWAAIEKLTEIFGEMKIIIESNEEPYLKAYTVRTVNGLDFKIDLELLYQENGRIDFRVTSRTPIMDFGVTRRLVEGLRIKFNNSLN